MRGILMFYSDEDRIVYLTLFKVLSVKYNIVALTLALMYNHTHYLMEDPTLDVMAKFNAELASKYALAFNRDCGRKGALFKKAYGNSPKHGEKTVRTSIAYTFNNSVEKRLYPRPEQDRWMLLAYLKSDHPFSEKIDLEKATKAMRRGIAMLKSLSSKNVPLSYTYIRKLFDGLNEKESLQMKDAIISSYLPINKEVLLSYYKSYEDMIIAINSNTGSEYDIKEDFDDVSHIYYRDMLSIIAKSSYADNPKSVLVASPARKKKIADTLARMTGAKYNLIRRVLDL
ncbi:MAG: hypothetical protein J5769_01230 [Bacteroidales bacterium]|nr:hypothetical protein [Bacteroidales bacterium]